MGYNATGIITRFTKFAGRPHGYEPGKRGRTRQRFPSGAGSSLYYATDNRGRVVEIQSYGSHFPLARLLLTPSGRPRMWLLNGDRWGSGGFGRTNEHNDIMRAAAQASGTPWFILPFSAMRAAGISPGTIRPVHVEPETTTFEDHSAATLDEVPEQHRKRHVFTDDSGQVIEPPRDDSGTSAWPDNAGSGWYVQRRRLGDNGYGWYSDPVNGPAYTGHLQSSYEHNIEPGPDGRYHWATERHWLGASVFRARYSESGFRGRSAARRWTDRNRWAYFVSAFDYNEPFPLWFMSELPRGARPATVAEAIDALKPDSVRDAEAAGIPVLRQGDVFVIAEPGVTEHGLLAAGGELTAFTPKSWEQGGGRFVNDSHTATRVIAMPDGALYARGIMRHRPRLRRPDHASLELWDRQTWGRVALNTQARSFDNSPRSWARSGDVD